MNKKVLELLVRELAGRASGRDGDVDPLMQLVLGTTEEVELQVKAYTPVIKARLEKNHAIQKKNLQDCECIMKEIGE